MIYGKSRNVVVIQNIDSGYVEQAILILKKDLGEQEYYSSEDGIVKEAQRIIDRYYQSLAQSAPPSGKKHTLPRLFLLFAAAALITTVVFLLK